MGPYGTSGGRSDGTRPGAEGASDGGGAVGVGVGVGVGGGGVGIGVGAGVLVGVGAGVRVGVGAVVRAGVGVGVGAAGAGVVAATAAVGMGVGRGVGEGPCAGGGETAEDGVGVGAGAVRAVAGSDGAMLGSCDDGPRVGLGVTDGSGEPGPSAGNTVEVLGIGEGETFAMAGGPDGSSVTPRTLPSSRGTIATARSATPTIVITTARTF